MKLIIEVGGYSHNFKAQEDKERDKVVADLSFTELRFSDEEVMKDLPNVQQTLDAWIADAQKEVIPLTPFKGDFLYYYRTRLLR